MGTGRGHNVDRAIAHFSGLPVVGPSCSAGIVALIESACLVEVGVLAVVAVPLATVNRGSRRLTAVFCRCESVATN